MKTCKNCKHLRKDERFGEHDPRWKCDNYKDEEGKESSFDRLGDNEAAADNGNCINWAEKNPIEEQSVENVSETHPIVETQSTPVIDEIEEMRKELESLQKFKEEVKRRTSDIEDAKEESSRAQKYVKELRESLEEYIEDFEPAKSLNATDHPLLFSDKKEPESNAVTDEWKLWPAKDHFDFTEKEWELMAEGVTEMTVGYLSDFCVRLSREKVKGFGESKRQKLEVQFMNFWTAHPELCDSATETNRHKSDALDENDSTDEESNGQL